MKRTIASIFVYFNVSNKDRWVVSDLFGEDSDVLVEGVGGAHVSSRHPGLAGSACGQLALLKDQSQQRKQRVTAGTTTHEPFRALGSDFTDE